MEGRGDAFAIATVVRTVSVTAAKPGAKAIVCAQGEIIDGWIGGGCARHAVIQAALQCMSDGQARLVSLKPEELIADPAPGVENGVVVARNMCPSKGSMEIFVEPMLSNPILLVIGNSPVAHSLATMAASFDLRVQWHNGIADQPVNAAPYQHIKNPEDIDASQTNRYIVVATQGQGDIQGLELALSLSGMHTAFVGSRRKIEHLRNKLKLKGVQNDALLTIDCPAGIDISAVTPQEIALSILAQIIQFRRTKSTTRKPTQ